jgi:hypothetical protein
MDATSSTEKGEESDVCNAFPYLSYLRSHLKEFLETRLSAEPLAYSFYVKNVLPPYRSRLEVASAPTTSFCYLEKYFTDCTGKEAGEFCPIVKDVAVCLPNSDTATEGTCVSCRNGHLGTAIQNGALKDEARIRDLNSTCEPKSRGPNRRRRRRREGRRSSTFRRLFWRTGRRTTELRVDCRGGGGNSRLNAARELPGVRSGEIESIGVKHQQKYTFNSQSTIPNCKATNFSHL